MLANTHRLIGHHLAAALLSFLATLPAHAAANDAPRCLNLGAWTAPGSAPSAPVPPAELLSDMARRDVVLLGEYHDEDDHHRWQVQTLAALHMLRPDMVIGFEMFPRRVQPALDKWVAGELTVKQFLEQSDWRKVWNAAPELYLPLFQFARINRIPMVALNVENSLNKAIRAKGWDAVPQEQREGVGKPAVPSTAYREYLFDVYASHASPHASGQGHGGPGKKDKARMTDSDFLHFVESQTTWDRAMAEALARRAQPSPSGSKPLVVGIMGSAHIRYDYGVPHQLRDLGIKNIGTLLAMPHDTDCKDVRSGVAHAVFGLPAQAEEKPDPPRLGVRLDEKDGAVSIAEVTPGSLAEKTGLKPGDRLLEVAGAAVTETPSVVYAVRRQPAGSWLPMRVRRGDETLDIVVKFPVTR